MTQARLPAQDVGARGVMRVGPFPTAGAGARFVSRSWVARGGCHSPLELSQFFYPIQAFSADMPT